jgi:hypothetical protein
LKWVIVSPHIACEDNVWAIESWKIIRTTEPLIANIRLCGNFEMYSELFEKQTVGQLKME